MKNEYRLRILDTNPLCDLNKYLILGKAPPVPPGANGVFLVTSRLRLPDEAMLTTKERADESVWFNQQLKHHLSVVST